MVQMKNSLIYNDPTTPSIPIGDSIDVRNNQYSQEYCQLDTIANIRSMDIPKETSSVFRNIDNDLTKIIVFLDNNYRNRLLSLIHTDTFEPGCMNNTISFIGTLFKFGETAVVQWICQLYQENLNNPSVLIGLLNVNIYYSSAFHSVGTIMALAAMTNRSQEVKELGIRVLESNYSEDNYRALQSIQCEDKWLMDYIQQVIIDFEKELCLK